MRAVNTGGPTVTRGRTREKTLLEKPLIAGVKCRIDPNSSL